MEFKDQLKKAAKAGLEKVEEITEVDPVKLTPAQREHAEAWAARTEAAGRGEPLPDGRLVGKALPGPAGEVVHGLAKAPEGPPPLEELGAWREQVAVERAERDQAREPYLAGGPTPSATDSYGVQVPKTGRSI